MKVILELPDEEVEIIKRNGFNKDGTFSFKLNEVVKQAIRNGVILPDNATNGDMINAVFRSRRWYPSYNRNFRGLPQIETDDSSGNEVLDVVLMEDVKEAPVITEQEIVKPYLDKIRAEIEQLRLHKAQFLTNDNKVCIDSQEVLNILDKYKAESEGA